MNVKDKITMAEFGAVVNVVVSKCFEDGGYDPTYQDFWLKHSLISVFCDYPFESVDVEEVFERLQDADSEESLAWDDIFNDHYDVVDKIRVAIEKSIRHKNSIGAYSMTDMALTNLIDAISEKVDSMSDIFTEDNMKALVDVSGKLSKMNNVSQKKIISTIIESFGERGIKAKGE